MNAYRINLTARRGFTLIEVVMSVLMLAILLAGVEASLVASTKAIPDTQSYTGALSNGAAASNRLTGELAYALSVTEMTEKTITFTVADRNGDGNPETIRYAWSGTAGDPLTRQYNGGATGNIAASVQAFSMQYDKTSQPYYTYSEGAETLVFSYSNTLLAQDVDVSKDSRPGQYIEPSLPSGAVSWRVTRVKFRARKKGASDGNTAVQLRMATPSGAPTNRVIDQATMVESSLDSNYAWVEYAFSGHSGLNPNKGLCVVLDWINDADSGQIQKNTLSLFGASKYVRSTTSGATWSVSTLDNMLMYVYGKPTTQNPVAYNYYLTNVNLSLRTSSNSKTAVATTVKLLNTPQVTGP